MAVKDIALQKKRLFNTSHLSERVRKALEKKFKESFGTTNVSLGYIGELLEAPALLLEIPGFGVKAMTELEINVKEQLELCDRFLPIPKEVLSAVTILRTRNGYILSYDTFVKELNECLVFEDYDRLSTHVLNVLGNEIS